MELLVVVRVANVLIYEGHDDDHSMIRNQNDRFNDNGSESVTNDFQSLNSKYIYTRIFFNHENTDIACLAKKLSENDLNGTNKLLNSNIVEKYIKFARIRYDANNDIVIIKTTNLNK